MIMILCLVVSFPEINVSDIRIKIDQSAVTLIGATIDQFRYIKIQSKTIAFNKRLLGIKPTNSVVIPMSLVLRSIVLG